MLPNPIALANTIVATPIDILDRVYAKKGWAFVPGTNRPMPPVLNPREYDSIVMGDLARRWNLAYRPGRESVEAVALPMDVVFPNRTLMKERYPHREPKAFRRALMSRYGSVVRVGELLENSKIPLERCHWLYHDRLVLFRVDPNKLESALPDLAETLGAKYDSAKKTFEFSPGRFRAILAQSVKEDATVRVEGDPSRWPLAVLAVDAMSDTELTKVYADPSTKLVSIPLVAGKVHPAIQSYIDANFELFKGDTSGQFTGFDPKVSPIIEYFPLNAVGVRLTRRDGSTLTF